MKRRRLIARLGTSRANNACRARRGSGGAAPLQSLQPEQCGKPYNHFSPLIKAEGGITA